MAEYQNCKIYKLEKETIMYTQVTENDFIQAFIDMNREDNFSRDGLMSLYNFFEQLEDDTGEPMELDVIAICCDWYESTLDQIRQQYSNILDGDEDDGDLLDWLNDETMVIALDNGAVLYTAF